MVIIRECFELFFPFSTGLEVQPPDESIASSSSRAPSVITLKPAAVPRGCEEVVRRATMKSQHVHLRKTVLPTYPASLFSFSGKKFRLKDMFLEEQHGTGDGIFFLRRAIWLMRRSSGFFFVRFCFFKEGPTYMKSFIGSSAKSSRGWGFGVCLGGFGRVWLLGLG